MNFLNPIFLFSLAAVAVPLLIHIFSRRRIPEIPFSTLRFLKRSDRRSMRRVNFRRWLLLLLRIAAVALLALAFARPVIKGRLAGMFGESGAKAVCIMLDKSYSMGVEEEGGLLFDRARERVREIFPHLNEDDEVTIFLFDDTPEQVFESQRFRSGPALDLLERMEPAWGETDLREGIRAARDILERSRREARELFVISDFQRSALSARAPRVPGEEPAAERRGDGGSDGGRIREYLLPVQSDPGPNVSVEKVFTPRVAIHKGEIVALRILLKNHSPSLGARFPLRVSLDGTRIVEKEVEIAPRDSREEILEFPVEKTGWIKGEVSKKEDRLGADDRRFFSMYVREKVSLLLIADEQAFYLEQALSPDGVEGDIRLRRKGWKEFDSADLEGAEVLLLGTGKGPAGGDIGLIKSYAARGGRVLVLVLPQREALIRELSGSDPMLGFEPGRTMTIEEPREKPGFLLPFDREDLTGLSRIRFLAAPRIRGVPDDLVRIYFRDGSPFIWTQRLGRGSITFAALDPRPAAGDLPLSPYFLPLVQQLVLTEEKLPVYGEGATVEDEVIWEKRPGIEYTVRLPGGDTYRPGKPARVPPGAEQFDEIAGEVVIPAGREPGFLAVYEDSQLVWQVEVNPRCERESDLAVMSAEEVADSLGFRYYQVIGEGEEMAAGIHSAREGREISTFLVMVAILVFTLELFLAQRKEPGGERQT
ncbi:MAG: BatA and WFA domain-containing protein [Candidatus Krumholzibacteriota bacterium]|nr:BatA and WFA domain-containing protein [Candidatus Krumholzibacteriota bacterium]